MLMTMYEISRHLFANGKFVTFGLFNGISRLMIGKALHSIFHAHAQVHCTLAEDNPTRGARGRETLMSHSWTANSLLWIKEEWTQDERRMNSRRKKNELRTKEEWTQMKENEPKMKEGWTKEENRIKETGGANHSLLGNQDERRHWWKFVILLAAQAQAKPNSCTHWSIYDKLLSRSSILFSF